MNTNPSHQPILRWSLQHYVELLTALTVLFVLQTGLVPFDFAMSTTRPGSTALFGATVTVLTFPDIISNIFLYVPVGVFLHWTLSRTVQSRMLVILVTITLAAVLSIGVEWIQSYSPVRISSIIDFVSNVVGAAVGVSISCVARWAVPRLVVAAIYEFHYRPHSAVLKIYCSALVLFAALPFSFSFDMTRMKQAVKSANFIPFRASTIDLALADDLLAKGDYIEHSNLRWRHMKRWSRWTVECASFAVLAWLLQAVIRGEFGFGRLATTALVWWMGGGLAVSLSVLQLMIISRACDITDVLFRLIGLLLGLVTLSVYLRDSKHLMPELRAQRWCRLAKIGCIGAVGYIVFTGLIPFTFDAQEAGPTASLASKSFLPFFAYFVARFDVMMDDVMEKFISFVVFSLLLTTCWRRAIGAAAEPRMWAIISAGLALSVAIEIVQMFITVRVTSLTDPILAGGGCLAGALAQQHAARFYRFATTSPSAARVPAPYPAEPTRELAPADALVATLMEPKPGAPAEPSHAPGHKIKR